MRRALALSLLLIFGWTLAAPFFAPSLENQLPACCRRHGAHRCMMRMMEQAGSGPHLTSVTQRCPLWPHATGAAHPLQWFPPQGRLIQSSPRSVAALPVSLQEFVPLRRGRSHLERGPPHAPLFA